MLWSCACVQVPPSSLVQLRQGPVRGYRDPHLNVYTFYNLPYATAPQGKDRFKAPLPPPTWTSIRNSVDQGIICPQQYDIPDLKTTLNPTPDCLIANVFMPNTNFTNMPIIVFVHGGGYQGGYGNHDTPRDLVANNNIIGVTFNYRLGPYGFLCLGTESTPGNAGMKDQVALLRWVKDNIASFGGNPDHVTIDGCSAGGSVVDLLLLSKSAEGLFHKAIPTSGANVGVWSVQIDPIANAKKLAKALNFENLDDIHALENFLQSIPIEQLSKGVISNKLDSNFLFVPCVERDNGVERFLDDAPVNILTRGAFRKVPMLYGFTNLEGMLRVYFGFYEIFKDAMNSNFSDVLPHDLQFESAEDKNQVAERIKQFYFGNNPVGDNNIEQFVNYFTDTMIAYPVLRATTLQVRAGNNEVYLYEYTFSEGNVFLPPHINATLSGALHCKQKTLVRDTPPGIVLGNQTVQMRNILREIWINFIRHGAPVPEGSSLPRWSRVTADRSPYMVLTLPPRIQTGSPHPERARLWDDIYSKHYRMPAAPNSAFSAFTNLTIIISMFAIIICNSFLKK